MSYNNIGNKALFKNVNLERLIRQTNVLLEHIFKAGYKEFERTWYPLHFVITAVASTSSLTEVGADFNFPFSYLLEAIVITNETNNLAEVALKIDGQIYPIESYTVALSANTPVLRGFKGTPEGNLHIYKLFIPKTHKLKLAYINTHGSNQEISLTLLGYRVSQKEALLIVNKKGAVYYE